MTCEKYICMNIPIYVAWWCVQVTDFGLSRAVVPGSAPSIPEGNYRWSAPEVQSDGKYTTASDVYSFGIVLWELLAWELPFSGLNDGQVWAAVNMRRERPPLAPREELPSR
jgi:serine/threonine protein kinase